MKATRQRRVFGGLVFGTGAIVSMLQPVVELKGYQADGRYLFLVLISAFGGVWSGLIAAIMAVTTRLTLGGQGAVLGTFLIIACSGLSVIWRDATRKKQSRNIWSWLILSLIASFPIGLGFALVYPDAPFIALTRLAFTLVCILIFGKLMEMEKRRADREQELDREAGMDFLTRLPNRRAMTAHLSSPKMKANKPRAYLVVDIDHFKAINDEHGHLIGDEVLREIGSRLQSSIRREDYAARVGGEEFAIVLCAATSEEAQRVAERIRNGLSQELMIDGKTLRVTASLGGIFTEGSALDPESAFNLADQALYVAKRSGRNQSVFSLTCHQSFIQSRPEPVAGLIKPS